MATTADLPPPGFEDLSIDDKIAYVQSLWDLIASDLDNESIPAWQQRILEGRLAELEANPDSVVSWEEVIGRLTREISSIDSAK